MTGLIAAPVVCVVALLLATSVCAHLPSLEAWLSALLLLFPGFVAGTKLFRESELLERIFLSVALAFLGSLFFLYCAAFIPPLHTQHTLLAALTLAACLLAWLPLPSLTHKMPGSSAELHQPMWAFLCLILVVAGYTRLTALGSAEFQGDEARAVIMAEAVVQGKAEILFAHKKGPAEIIFPMGMHILTDQSTQLSARLPFALASLMTLLGLVAIARRLWPSQGIFIGILAAVLGTFDGFFLGFARIVQYQSLLVLYVCAAFLLAVASTQQKSPTKLLYLIALFSAGGLFSHFDTIFSIPILFLLVLPVVRAHPKQALAAFLFFAFTLATFYLPFLLHENIGGTGAYLTQRLGPSQLPVNNLPRYWALHSFYSTSFHSFVYIILPLACVPLLWKQAASKIAYVHLALVWLLLALSFFMPELFLLDGKRSWLLIPWTFVFVQCLTKMPKTNDPSRILLWWIAPGLFALGFLFARPNTHFYAIHAGLALAAAALLVHRYDKSSAPAKAGLGLLGTCFIILNLWYVHIVYLRQNPEYRHNFPRLRPAIFTGTYGNALPQGAFFGFPRRSGWEYIGYLYTVGQLKGSYDSNEEPLITAWYTRGAKRQQAWPDYYFISSNPNDPVPIPRLSVDKNYHFWGRIYVAGERRLDIYSREPLRAVPMRIELEAIPNLSTTVTLNLDQALPALGQSR